MNLNSVPTTRFLDTEALQKLKKPESQGQLKALEKADALAGHELVLQKDGKTETIRLSDDFLRSSQLDALLGKSQGAEAMLSLEVKGKTVLIPIGLLTRESLQSALSQALKANAAAGGGKVTADQRKDFAATADKLLGQLRGTSQLEKLGAEAGALSPEQSAALSKELRRNAPLGETLAKALHEPAAQLVLTSHDGQSYAVPLQKFLADPMAYSELFNHAGSQTNLLTIPQPGGKPLLITLGEVQSSQLQQQDLSFLEKPLQALRANSGDKLSQGLQEVGKLITSNSEKHAAERSFALIRHEIRVGGETLAKIAKNPSLVRALESALLSAGTEGTQIVYKDREGRFQRMELSDFLSRDDARELLASGGFIVGQARDGRSVALDLRELTKGKPQSFGFDQAKAVDFDKAAGPMPKDPHWQHKYEGQFFRELIGRSETFNIETGEQRAMLSHSGLSKALLGAITRQESAIVFLNAKGKPQTLPLAEFLKNPDRYAGLVGNTGYISLFDAQGKPTLISMAELTEDNLTQELYVSDIENVLTQLGREPDASVAGALKTIRDNRAAAEAKAAAERQARDAADADKKQKDKDLQAFSQQAAKKAPRDVSTTDISVAYWQKEMTKLYNWNKALEPLDLDAQGKVFKNIIEIKQLLGEARYGILQPKAVERIKALMWDCAEISKQVFIKDSDYHAAKSEWLGTAIKVAEVTRDAASNTVNAFADAIPALKPLATGMNAALAFIDTVGSGGSYASAALRAAVEGVMTNLPGGDTTKKELKIALGKAIAQSVADLMQAYDKGEPVSAEAFLEAFKANLYSEASGLGIGKLLENPALQVVMNTLAGVVYDTFLSGE